MTCAPTGDHAGVCGTAAVRAVLLSVTSVVTESHADVCGLLFESMLMFMVCTSMRDYAMLRPVACVMSVVRGVTRDHLEVHDPCSNWL